MRGRLHLNLSWSAKSIEGIDGLEDDLRKMGDIFCETVTTKAADIITKFAKTQMNEYYAEYTPVIYDRTNLMGGSSFQKYIDDDDDIYQGGVEINSGFTSHPGVPHKKSFDEAQIYTNVWDLGIHGYIRTTDPYYYLNVKGRKNVIKNGRVGSKVVMKKKRIYIDTNTKYAPIQGKPHRVDEIRNKIKEPGFQNQLRISGLSAMTKGNYSVLKFV